MTFLGALFGYDNFRNDVMGVNKDPQANCVVCGRCALTHSREQEAECFRRLHAGGIDGARAMSEAK